MLFVVPSLDFALEFAVAVGTLILIYWALAVTIKQDPRSRTYIIGSLILISAYWLAFPTTCLPLPMTPHCLALPRPFPHLQLYERYETPNINNKNSINVSSNINLHVPIHKSKPFASPQPCNFDASALAASTSYLLADYTLALSSSLRILKSGLNLESSQHLWTSFPFMRHLDFTSAVPDLESLARARAQTPPRRKKAPQPHSESHLSNDIDDKRAEDAFVLRKAAEGLAFLSERTPAEEEHLAAFRAIQKAAFELGLRMHHLETRLWDGDARIQEVVISVDFESLVAGTDQETMKSWRWQQAVRDNKRRVRLYAEFLLVFHTELVSIQAHANGLSIFIADLSGRITSEEDALWELYSRTAIPEGHDGIAGEGGNWALLTHAARQRVHSLQSHQPTSPPPPPLQQQQNGYLRTALSYFLSFFGPSQQVEDLPPPPKERKDKIAVWDQHTVARFETLHDLASRLHAVQEHWRDLTERVAHLRTEVGALEQWACFGV